MPVGCGTTNAPPPSPGDPRCLYSALGLTRSASEVEIKKAYRQQALRWHPDKNQDIIEEATERFQQIGKAYEILGDSQKRRRYDLEGTIEGEEAFEHQNMSDFMNLFAAAMSGGFMGPGMFFAGGGGGGGMFGGPQFYEVDSEDDDDDDEDDEVIFLDELLGGFGAHRSRRGRDAAEEFISAMVLDELLRGGLHRRGRYDDDDDDDEDWETVEDDEDEDEDEDDGPLLEALFLDHFAHPVTNRTTRGGAMKFKCGVCRCCGGGPTGSAGKTYNENGIHRHVTEDHKDWLKRFEAIIKEDAADIFDLDDDLIEDALDTVGKEMGRSKSTSPRRKAQPERKNSSSSSSIGIPAEKVSPPSTTASSGGGGESKNARRRHNQQKRHKKGRK
ncbi:hypothetical protein FOZ61_007905 [Perkinsus olseni]|uniref:J domain-containing protein n=1 Tax=Perkinsus olseni TaxID=32597 RepID=A0A7J6MHC8_PEROL|nr:hypothetical protein FOZ61_007905 [Perkinsus olseni]